MFEVQFSKDVVKFLKGQPLKFREKVINYFDVLSQNPYSTTLDITNLIGMKNHFRLRIGKYRFLYEIRNEEILIFCYKADSRGDIYK